MFQDCLLFTSDRASNFNFSRIDSLVIYSQKCCAQWVFFSIFLFAFICRRILFRTIRKWWKSNLAVSCWPENSSSCWKSVYLKFYSLPYSFPLFPLKHFCFKIPCCCFCLVNFYEFENIIFDLQFTWMWKIELSRMWNAKYSAKHTKRIPMAYSLLLFQKAYTNTAW